MQTLQDSWKLWFRYSLILVLFSVLLNNEHGLAKHLLVVDVTAQWYSHSLSLLLANKLFGIIVVLIHTDKMLQTCLVAAILSVSVFPLVLENLVLCALSLSLSHTCALSTRGALGVQAFHVNTCKLLPHKRSLLAPAGIHKPSGTVSLSRDPSLPAHRHQRAEKAHPSTRIYTFSWHGRFARIDSRESFAIETPVL